jgi:cyclopropane-fatty-acyl-phospholipid synthase
MLETQLEKWVLSQAGRPLPLELEWPDGRRIQMGPTPKVVIRLNDLGAVRFLLNPTLANVGSAYVEGRIDMNGAIEDIIDVAIGLADMQGNPEFVEPTGGLLARLLAHSKKRDRDAIQYHYDIPTEFYELFLDRSLVYSCGYFRDPGESIDDAQENKLDHILTKLRLRPGERMLDVGCGWGALAIRAAQRGADVVGITLSEAQLRYAQARIKELGLEGNCEVRLQDYREVPHDGGYDKIVSVGMFEHVGRKNLGAYFEILYRLLRDGGAMLMHGITAMHPELTEVGSGGGEFMDRYVFPDGELPHISHVIRGMSEASLEVVDVESLRRHYALTLGHWARRLDSQAELAREIAGEKRFRIWRVYLAGCAYAFRYNWMNIYQVLACKLGGPSANPFPFTRDWMYR